jgi:WD40 repeat protein/energy-coupling factor transporter ATP-binding protein EcfA2
MPEESKTSPVRLPYPGLRPFEEIDAPIFFGRHTQIVPLVRQLRRQHFVAVVGASGSGKSSLVRAGLLPSIRQGALGSLGKWQIHVMKPGNNPAYNLACILNDGTDSPPDEKLVETTRAEVFSTHGSMSRLLQKLDRDTGDPFLLVVDQFEELFGFLHQDRARDSSATRAESSAFVRFILNSVSEKSSLIRIVTTMRTDFMGDCEIFLGLPEMINQSQFLVPRLDRELLKEAIIRPASVDNVGYPKFVMPDSLADEIINEVGTRSDYLPLMQHALMRTWKIASDDGQKKITIISRDDYQKSGGIQDALNQGAEKAWLELQDETDLRDLCRPIFLLLCDENEEGRITRRRPKVGEVRRLTGASLPQIEKIWHHFQTADRNFLLPIVGEGKPDLTDQDDLDISHEAFLRNWKTYKEWQKAEQEDLAELRNLTHRVARSREDGFSPLTSKELVRLADWRERTNAHWAQRYLDGESASASFEEITTFIDRSIAHHKSLHRKNIILVSAAVLALFGGLAFYARSESKRAEEAIANEKIQSELKDEAKANESRAILAEAEAISTRDYANLQAATTEQNARRTQALQNYLANLLSKNPETRDDIQRLAKKEGAAVLDNLKQEYPQDPKNPDAKKNEETFNDLQSYINSSIQSIIGRDLAAASPTEESPILLAGHSTSVWGAQFLKSGKIASWSGDGTVRVWNLDSPEENLVIQASQARSGVTAGEIVPLDGTEYIVAGDSYGVLRAFDSDKGNNILDQLTETPAHQETITDIWAIPKPTRGELFYTTSADQTAKIWSIKSLSSGEPTASLPHPAAVTSVSGSRTGELVVTTSEDRSFHVWKRAKKLPFSALRKSEILRAQCLPDGGLFVISGDAGGLDWMSIQGKTTFSPAKPSRDRNESPIISLEFSPSGNLLASGDSAGTVSLWKPATKETLPELFAEGFARVLGLAVEGTKETFPELFADKSPIVRPNSNLHSVRLYQSNSKQEQILCLAWSPDGTRLAAGTLQGKVILWNNPDVNSNPLVLTGRSNKGHTGPVWSVAFNKDSTRLVSASGYSPKNLPPVSYQNQSEDWKQEPPEFGLEKPRITSLASKGGPETPRFVPDNNILVWLLKDHQLPSAK